MTDSLGWISESGAPEPAEVRAIDDNTRAAHAAAWLREGEALLWRGDFPNGRRFGDAVRKRLERERRGAKAHSLAERWAADRARTSRVAEAMGRLLVRVEPDGSVDLPRAQDTREAVRQAWGLDTRARLVGLSTLVGAMGAAGWAAQGLDVPGLKGSLRPAYGVFSPTRHAYVGLLKHLSFEGRSVLDVGCGTGVLGLVSLQRGAASVVAVDIDPRAVACATDNAMRLGLAVRLRATQADLWPDDSTRFDTVIFNAPWMPEQPRTRLDRAVFDPGGEAVSRWLTQLTEHLAPGGFGALIVSDLPERLGLREPGALEQSIHSAGLRVVAKHATPAAHKRARRTDDPLHQARAAEQVVLWELV